LDFSPAYELRAIETINYTKQTMPDLIDRVTGALKTMLEEKQ